MTAITRYSKPQKRSSQATSKSSKFTQRKATSSAVRLAEEVKAYRKAKVAFRVYASIGDFDKALDELMKLNERTSFSQHPCITGDSPDGFCFSKYPGRWTQGMLKLIPVKKLIDFRCERSAEICFGNLEIIDAYLKQQRHKVVYNLIASKKLKVNRKQLSSYIHECLARQPYVYPIYFFPDWKIKVNWVEQKLISYDEATGEAAGGGANAN
nr:MAG TPA: hypothetical protein [Caudoviricetes sp.]